VVAEVRDAPVAEPLDRMDAIAAGAGVGVLDQFVNLLAPSERNVQAVVARGGAIRTVGSGRGDAFRAAVMAGPSGRGQAEESREGQSDQALHAMVLLPWRKRRAARRRRLVLRKGPAAPSFHRRGPSRAFRAICFAGFL